MNVQIQATKIELTEAIKGYVQEKMDMLEKYLGDVQVLNCDAEIGVSVGGQHHGDIFFCEINLNVPHSLIRVRKEENDLYKAIDKVKDHLERSIVKYKEKRK
jgi:ribosomal subunit interface protein